MNKIKYIYPKNLRNDEHFQFVDFVLALVKEKGAAALRVEPRYNALAALHRDEDEALKKIVKSALTARIVEADSARDGVFRGLADAARAGLNHFNHDTREAAVRVGIVMGTYGNVAEKSHVEETSAIHNLLVELTTKRAADIETLGLVPWIGELDRLNVAVAKLLEGRADEEAGRTALVLRRVRARVDEAYLALTAMVEAQEMVASVNADQTAVAMYADFALRLNERIELVNEAMAVRRGRAAAARKREEQEAAAAAGMDVEVWRATRAAEAAAQKAAETAALADARAGHGKP